MQVRIIDGTNHTINVADGGSEELILSHEDLIPLAMLLLTAWQGCPGEVLTPKEEHLLLGGVGDPQEV
jgi:hypothetical protein